MQTFSIIIATYNAQAVIEKCLKTIFNQSYLNYEVIIVDAESSDKTLSIIEKYKNQIFKIISESDNGIYDAWNKGLKIANNKWIMFIGSDDELLRDSLESYNNFIENNKLEDYDFISSKNELIDINGVPIKIMGEAWNWNVFKRHMNVAHVGSLHNSNYFKRYGEFNQKYKIAGDYELLLRAQDKLKAAFLNKINGKMANGGVSFTNSNVFKETFEAKLKSGNISYLSCLLEDFSCKLKFYFKKLIGKK